MRTRPAVRAARDVSLRRLVDGRAEVHPDGRWTAAPQGLAPSKHAQHGGTARNVHAVIAMRHLRTTPRATPKEELSAGRRDRVTIKSSSARHSARSDRSHRRSNVMLMPRIPKQGRMYVKKFRRWSSPVRRYRLDPWSPEMTSYAVSELAARMRLFRAQRRNAPRSPISSTLRPFLKSASGGRHGQNLRPGGEIRLSEGRPSNESRVRCLVDLRPPARQLPRTGNHVSAHAATHDPGGFRVVRLSPVIMARQPRHGASHRCRYVPPSCGNRASRSPSRPRFSIDRDPARSSSKCAPRASVTAICIPRAATGRSRRRSCWATKAPASCARSARVSRRVAVGDHVVLCWAPPCGECPSCREGRAVLCDRVEKVTFRNRLPAGQSAAPRARPGRRDISRHRLLRGLRRRSGNAGPLPCRVTSRSTRWRRSAVRC